MELQDAEEAAERVEGEAVEMVEGEAVKVLRGYRGGRGGSFSLLILKFVIGSSDMNQRKNVV